MFYIEQSSMPQEPSVTQTDTTASRNRKLPSTTTEEDLLLEAKVHAEVGIRNLTVEAVNWSGTIGNTP